MKIRYNILFIIVILVGLSSCTVSQTTTFHDDLYFNKSDVKVVKNTTPKMNEEVVERNVSEESDFQASEHIDDYDHYYASRINRFHNPYRYSAFGYYAPIYTNSFWYSGSNWGYYTQIPVYQSPNFTMSVGYGNWYGSSFNNNFYPYHNFGYTNPYYNNYFGYTPWRPHYNGGWGNNSWFSGNNYTNYSSANPKVGVRGSRSSVTSGGSSTSNNMGRSNSSSMDTKRNTYLPPARSNQNSNQNIYQNTNTYNPPPRTSSGSYSSGGRGNVGGGRTGSTSGGRKTTTKVTKRR